MKLNQSSQSSSSPKVLSPLPEDLRKVLWEVVYYMEVRRSLDRIFQGENAPSKIVISSLVPGEGKTLFTLAAAWSLSERLGKKVLILDATNFERPSSIRMHDVCGVEADRALEIQKATLGPSSLSYVWFPPSKLGVPALKSQIEKLSAGFDVVLMDVVALNVSSRLELDPIELASVADGLVLVRSECRVDEEKGVDWIQELKSRGVNILGVLSNSFGGEL